MGLVLLSQVAEVAEEEKVGGGRRGGHTWCNFKEMCCNFSMTFFFCFFFSLEMFLYATNPSSTVCISFSAHSLEESMSQKKSKVILNNWSTSANLSNINLFLAQLFLGLLPHCLALV